ncbi:MAG: hypothetical protein GY714_08645 [Desulfobacterales bacterium]|nr:hypothetical protein [Desulfobacterales bacterium]
MNTRKKIDLSDIPAPAIIESVTFEDLLKEKIGIIKSIVKEWEPIESDDYSVIAESWAYDDIHHRVRFNNAIKAMLLPYSTGSDLDNLACMYGVERLPGTKPKAKYTFKLTRQSDQTETIMKGNLLVSADGSSFSSVYEDIVFEAGSTEQEGIVELDDYIEASQVKTTVFVTPMPFIESMVDPCSTFYGGSSPETDEDFRERILFSLYSWSTAGSEESYIYWTQTADVRIEDVAVRGSSGGIVDIYVLSEAYDEVLESCGLAVGSDRNRPLTDNVVFHEATIKTVDIEADITVSDRSMIPSIERVHKDALKELSFKLGEDLFLSKLYSILHIAGVTHVEIASPTVNQIALFNEAVKIENIKLNYS